MRMISSRTLAFLDTQSLAPGHVREALFRVDSGGFLLYLGNGEPSEEERVLSLGLREALIWLNEPPQEPGSFWI